MLPLRATETWVTFHCPGLTTDINCAHYHLCNYFARAIRVQLFLNCTRIHVITYTVMITELTRHYAPFVYKPPPPYYLHEFAAEVYLSPIYTPLSLCDSNERQEG